MIIIELLESRISPVIPLYPKIPSNGATISFSLSFTIKSPFFTKFFKLNSLIKSLLLTLNDLQPFLLVFLMILTHLH